MGFRGRRLDAGGWTPGAGRRGLGAGAGERVRRRGSRRGGLGSEAGGRSGGWGGRATERKDGRDGRNGRDGRDGRAGLEKLEKVPPRPGPGLSRVRSVTLPRSAKGPFRQGPGSPEFLPGRVAPPLFSPPPFPPLHFLLSSTLRLLNPSGAPPLHPAFRCGEAAGAAIRPPGVESPEPRCGTGFRVRSEGVAAASGAPLPRPPGSRPEPTPGRQTSRERGTGVPEKGKNKEQERVFEQKGP